MLTKIESAWANTILNGFSKDYHEFITHMKLQKILYFSLGNYLARFNDFMPDHNFQAWPYGPVLPSLYNELKRHRDTHITELIMFDGTAYIYENGDIFETIYKTIKKLRCYTAWELSEMTHAKDGPWFRTVEMKGYKKDIDFDLIKSYFLEHPVL